MPFSADHVEEATELTFHECARAQFAEFDIWEYPKDGIALYLNSIEIVQSIFPFDKTNVWTTKYSGVLPLDIHFSLDFVERKLGKASISGVNKLKNRPWLRYDNESFVLHLEFSSEKSALMKVTLMSRSLS